MFDHYYEVFLADTPKSKEIHYSIRYQVYCEEMDFENKNNFPLEQEFDEYDSHSVHFIVNHKPSGHWVGDMRLIIKDDQLLPIERLCILNENINNDASGLSVEISRLCLLKEIRRRSTDSLPPFGIGDYDIGIKDANLNHFRCDNRDIIWGMIYAAAVYSYYHGMSHWYYMTTRALDKILRKGGLNMMVIGEPCQHKGIRYPFKMDAFATFHNDMIWKGDYNKGYRLFSELQLG
jgi:N-acyl amino acid synthase of PEP-CTERM/exosortase system